jgi:hypothetical protein
MEKLEMMLAQLKGHKYAIYLATMTFRVFNEVNVID